jgi:hypothetical protein
MNRVKRLLIVLTINIVWGSCWATSAHAGVITSGTWTAMNPDAFWNNLSYDGPGLNVGQLLIKWGWDVEYLSAGGAPVAFAFDQPAFFWEATSITAWKTGRGIWQEQNGSIGFGTHGYLYNTLTTPRQFSLFRHVDATRIVYFLGVEDIPPGMPSDRDYNDYIGYTIEQLPPPPPPTATPEPGTLLLMACGALVFCRKRQS